jgi:hypothetical protein
VEEFIFEHYYGFSKVSDTVTSIYQVEHPRWMMHEISRYEVDCDFGAMYGDSFAYLGNLQPDSVMIARGSRVWIKWKRTKLTVQNPAVAAGDSR